MEIPVLVCSNVVSPLILGSNFIVKSTMILDLINGNAYFIFGSKQVFSCPQ
jgi:hypothetical protein